MNANLNGYYKEIDRTMDKKDELLALLKNQSVSVHTSEEADFDYMENDDLALVVKNPACEEDLQIELGAVFSLFFGLWHGQYDAYNSDYERMKKDLAGILDGSFGAMAFYMGGKWNSSALCRQKLTAETDAAALLNSEDVPPETAEKLRAQGGRIELLYWNPAENRTFEVPAGA